MESGIRLLFRDLDHLSSLVLAAVRTDAMRQLGLMAVGAFGEDSAPERIVGPPRRGPPLGMASFWIGHENLPTSRFFSAPPSGHRQPPRGSRSLSDSDSARRPGKFPYKLRYRHAASAAQAERTRAEPLQAQSRRRRKTPSPIRFGQWRPLRHSLPLSDDNTTQNPNRAENRRFQGNGRSRPASWLKHAPSLGFRRGRR